MSQFLFPHTKVAPRELQLRLAVIGLAGFVLLGGILGVLGLQTLGVLSGDIRVTVQLATVGDTLGINSDVKYNGLRVGRVTEVDPVADEAATGWDGPTATVLVDPAHAELIPGSVRARVLPGTLFGNEYVDLVVTPATAPKGGARATPAGTLQASPAVGDAHLSDGAVVPADTSVETLRLMDTFEATQRLLAAVDPSQWDLAISQLADSLDGRGNTLATMIRDGEAVLGRWEKLQPQVRRDLDLLTVGSDLAAEVEPRLIAALEDTRPLARTLVEREKGTTTLLTGFVDLLDGKGGMTTFLLEHGEDLSRLLNATAANLEVFAQRSPAFAALLQKVPALLQNGAKAVKNGRIQMEGVLSPQMIDPYDADDCPSYRGLPGRCGGGR